MKARGTWEVGMQTDLKEWRRAEGGEEEVKGLVLQITSFVSVVAYHLRFGGEGRGTGEQV